MRYLFIFVLLVSGLAGCSFFGATTEEEKPVARVGKKFLYKRDLVGLVPARTPAADSANIVARYIDTWVKRQLMLAKAESSMQIDQFEIDRRMQEYKYQLITHAYEQEYIKNNLDTVVTEAQIGAYYTEYKDNFPLKQNIVRALYVKFPKEQKELKVAKAKDWLRSRDEKDREKLNALAANFGIDYHLQDTAWLDFDDLVMGTPFQQEITNPVSALKPGNFFQTTDDSYVYYLYISDAKVLDQISPLAFVKDQITDIIISRRKVELRQKLEQEVYDKAQEHEDYEVFQQ